MELRALIERQTDLRVANKDRPPTNRGERFFTGAITAIKKMNRREKPEPMQWRGRVLAAEDTNQPPAARLKTEPDSIARGGRSARIHPAARIA